MRRPQEVIFQRPKDAGRGRPQDVGRRYSLALHRGLYMDVHRTSFGTSSGHSRDVILPSGINVGNFSCRYFLNKLRRMSFTFFNELPANLNILFRTESPYLSTISASRVRPSGNEYALFVGETFHQNSSLSLYLYHHH